MENNIPKSLQSSVDSTKISLTVESLGKTIGGLVILFASVKGIDPVIATAWWGALVAQAGIVVSSGYATYHAGVMLWGMIRKGVAWYGARKNAQIIAPVVAPIVTPAPVEPVL